MTDCFLLNFSFSMMYYHRWRFLSNLSLFIFSLKFCARLKTAIENCLPITDYYSRLFELFEVNYKYMRIITI